MATKETQDIITPEAIASYPFLFTPQIDEENGKVTYSVDLLFEKGTPEVDELVRKGHQFALEVHGIKNAQGETVLPSNFKSPFKDGDLKVDRDGTPVPEYANKVYFTAKSIVKQPIVAADGRTEIIKREDFYAGVICRANIRFAAYGGQGTKFGAGISVRLQGIQKVRDGEPLGNVKPRSVDGLFAPAGGAPQNTVAQAPQGFFG